jgi:hypothetical protein
MEDRVILALPPGIAKSFLEGNDALRKYRISFSSRCGRGMTLDGWLSYVCYENGADEGFFTTKRENNRGERIRAVSDID